MNAGARATFERDLDKDPPEVTVENITATAFKLAGDAQTIFERGLVNAFRMLSREYRSHDRFKVGKRIVLEYALGKATSFDWQHWGTYVDTGAKPRLADVERTFAILDGKPKPVAGDSIIEKISGPGGSAD